MTRRARAAIALGAAAVMAVGCGSGGDDTVSRPAGAATASAAPATTASPAPRPRRRPGGAVSARARRQLRFPRLRHVAPGRHAPAVRRRAGRPIRVVRDGRTLDRPFLDIRPLVTSGGEQGLLSMAFAPDYARSGLFYVYYTDTDQNQRVVEYRRGRDGAADPGSARLVLEMDDSESNHNGGLLLFGPDRLLYIGTGDGGGGGDLHGPRGNAQNLGSLLGKILRIDPRRSGGRPYSVPRDNPFVGRSGARREIYAYGLRNPWRFSFDRRTRDLIIGDVGQNAWEEIDFAPRSRGAGRGANFGWRPFEGRAVYTSGESAPGHVDPVIVRSHDDGNCSITGGVVVRDPVVAGLEGRYVFGDFCRGRIESARLGSRGAFAVRESNLRVPSLSSFGQDARGRVYAVSLEGPVYRFVAK
jgi:glucose/arabinose dehydrogenase